MPTEIGTWCLHFVQQHIDGETLEIELKDIASALEVHLYYRVFPETGILERWSRIENQTDQAITPGERAVGCLDACRKGRATAGTISPAIGGRSGSCTPRRCKPGTHIIESRRGSTSHQSNPWFAIDRPATNHRGERPGLVRRAGLERQLAHDGGRYAENQVRVTGGFNPFDFGYPLNPAKGLDTPHFMAGYTQGDSEKHRG